MAERPFFADYLHIAARRLSRLTLLGHWQKGKSGRLRMIRRRAKPVGSADCKISVMDI